MTAKTICIIFSLLAVGIHAQERTHDITIEDYFTQSYVSNMTVSPDGNYLAYTESRWGDKDKGRNRELWILDLNTKERTRLTFKEKSLWHIQWDDNSEHIYFGAKFEIADDDDDPESQVWRIRKNGSDVTPLSRVNEGIKDFKIEGRTIYYVIDKEHIIDDWNTLRKEFSKDVEYGHGIHKVSEIWKLDMNTWRSEKLVDESRYIRYFDVAPEGRKIAMITGPDQHLITHEGKSEVDIYDADSGEVSRLADQIWREEAESPYGWLENPTWSENGDTLAFTISFDGYPTRLFVASGDLPRELKRPAGAEVNGHLRWLEDGRLAFLADQNAHQRIFASDLAGKIQPLTGNDEVVLDFEVSGSNIYTIESGLTFNGDLFVRSAGKESERLINFNPQIDTWKLPQISSFKWTGANGDEVEGILELPPGYQPGKPLPTIIAIHGGPTSADYLNFRYWIYGRTAFAAKGYAVMSPNYRGSTGYGDTFMTDLIGRENDIEVEDILKGVDALIEKGIADPKRLGVTGWSNGGYLTNCLIATNRFQAASSGAGVFDQTIQWAEEDTPGHVVNYMDGLPWEKPEAYRKASPLYAFKKGIKTATLIHVGKEDARVPVSHSRGLHRALHHYIEAPCELIVYPKAGHGLSEYRHRLAKLKWDHAWFDKYLKP
ncbi:MAG: S9 family peptidase [Verrucomicrobiales bacterium]|nr:S9 family peptidase [Verrucomicrobiales bacterium]